MTREEKAMGLVEELKAMRAEAAEVAVLVADLDLAAKRAALAGGARGRRRRRVRGAARRGRPRAPRGAALARAGHAKWQRHGPEWWDVVARSIRAPNGGRP